MSSAPSLSFAPLKSASPRSDNFTLVPGPKGPGIFYVPMPNKHIYCGKTYSEAAMNITYPTFFLGAVSRNGFCSLFENCIGNTEYSYIIKGGPGSGKSTLMKKLSCEGCTHILCSSDPDSLDGILLPNGIAVFDGTFPHVLEPSVYRVNGEYIMLPPTDAKLNAEEKEELTKASRNAKLCYSAAYKLIDAAADIMEWIRLHSEEHADRNALIKRARGICKRELCTRGTKSVTEHRFIDGNTPIGPITLYKTAELMADRIWNITDSFGNAGVFFDTLLEDGTKKGYHIIVCHDASDAQIIRHMIFPEIRIAFVSSTPVNKYEGKAFRQINADKYTALPYNLRREIKGITKTYVSLLKAAACELGSAKLQHDIIEKVFKPHICFEAYESVVSRYSSLEELRNF